MAPSLALVVLLLRAAAPQAPGLTLDPSVIRAGIFFGGAEVAVEAEIPGGLQVAVELVGARQNVELARRGKVLGLFWMKAGEVKIEQAPQFYLLAASAAEAELASTEELERLEFGYTALRRRLRADGEPLDEETFEQFVKLKQSDGLYATQPAAVQLAPGASGATRHLRVVFHLPAEVPTGEHLVRLLTFENGQGQVRFQKNLSVEQAGAAHWITDVAHNHGLLYGISAVLVALAVGLFTGFLFGRGSRGSH